MPRDFRPFLTLGLAAAVLLGAVPVAHAATITVNTIGDDAVDTGACALREAITAANSNSASGATMGECVAGSAIGVDRIEFNIAPGGQQTITVQTSLLPQITSPIAIDGSTQPNPPAGMPPIVINGNDVDVAGAEDDILRLMTGSDGSSIQGLALHNAFARGIRVDNTSSIAIEGNWIGLNGAGAASANGVDGILVNNSTTSITIGDDTTAERNVVSGNTNFGINLATGASAVVKGNYIGLNPAGTAAIGNGDDGIIAGGNGAVIGGAAAGEGNVISGQSTDAFDAGITASGAAFGTQIVGNLIGTNAAGTADLGNTMGIELVGGSDNTLIGGTAAGAGNLISGNNQQGILAMATENVVIQGNRIGTNLAGTAALANTTHGMDLQGLTGNLLIGGTSDSARNLISGNGNMGIRINGGNPTVTIQRNYVGTSADGMSAIGNANQGVRIEANNLTGATVGGAGNGNVIAASGTNAMRLAAGNFLFTIQGNLIGTDANGAGAAATFGNNQSMDPGLSASGIFVDNGGNIQIGGAGAGEGNVIANTKVNDGIHLNEDAFGANRIRGNRIFNNGRLGIDLFLVGDPASGITANDVGDADAGTFGLGYQNFPVITAATRNSTTFNVSGTLNSTSLDTFAVDLFANTGCDGSGNGEGEIYLGSTTANTDAGGTGTFNASLPTTTPVSVTTVTATATNTSDLTGDSSEFSQCFTATVVPDTQPPVVTPPVLTPTPVAPAPAAPKKCKKGQKLKKGKCVKKKRRKKR
jgi:CSLREA domain-containing protein